MTPLPGSGAANDSDTPASLGPECRCRSASCSDGRPPGMSPRAVSSELRLHRAQPPPVWPMRFRLKAPGFVEVFSWKFARTMVLPVGVYRNCSVKVLPG